MKELILTLYTVCGGALLVANGLDTLSAIYMIALSAGMLGFTYHNLYEVAKNADTDGNQ
ncbi:hypothetical protein I7830_10760 [Mammaliicoccus sciuri]|uniref:hypothetical protein n=1 Tax=Mammaliicoccus sciuri TaxID=1296 RepID=UPI0018DCAF74|nr:hypothetical protein [Mammaliicoccus sciuri]QPW14144.1 hypothetical protein I7830_10760 [Mammaliicoccus sciuri]